MRKWIFLAVSASDLAIRNRIFLPPCRIRSTALQPNEGYGEHGPARRQPSSCSGPSFWRSPGADPTLHPSCHPLLTGRGVGLAITCSPGMGAVALQLTLSPGRDSVRGHGVTRQILCSHCCPCPQPLGGCFVI